MSPVRTSENPRLHGHTRLTPPMSEVQISNVNGPPPHTPGDPIRGLPLPQHLHHPLHSLHSRPLPFFPMPHAYTGAHPAAMAILQGHTHMISPHTFHNMNLQSAQPNHHPHMSRLVDQRRPGLPDPRINHILQSQGTTLEPVTNNHHNDLSVSNLKKISKNHCIATIIPPLGAPWVSKEVV